MVLESKQKGKHSKHCIGTGEAQWFAYFILRPLNIPLHKYMFFVATSFALGKSLTVVTGTH